MNPQVKLGYSYWSVGFQYLDMSENVSREIAKTGNTWVLIQKGTNWEEQERKYREMTKWADYNQGIPVIFNFYHGLELLFKGFLIAEGNSDKTHTISALCDLAKRTFPDQSFIAIAEKYIDVTKLPKLIADFIAASKSDIDMWYQAFKYPEDLKGNLFAHDQLIYREEDGATFFSELAEDIHQIRLHAVTYATSKYEGVT